jgi:hypothetical protein
MWVPLWVPNFLPLQDLAAHTEMACQWLRVGTDARLFTPAFPWPNSAPVVVLAAMQRVLPSYLATKCLLGAALAAWPLTILWWCKRHQRWWGMALLLLPTMWDVNFGYGFLQFVCAKPLMLVVLATHLPHAQTQPSTTLFDIARRALLWLLLFLTHSLAFAVMVVVCVVLMLMQRKQAALQRLRAFAPLVLVLLATMPFFLAKRPAGGQFVWAAPSWTDVGGILPSSHADEATWFIMLVCVAAVLWTQRGSLRIDGHAAMAGALLLVVAVAGPLHVPQLSVVGPRFWSVGIVVVVLAIAPAQTSRAWWLPLVLGCALQSMVMMQTWRSFSRELGDVETLLAAVPPDASFATDVRKPRYPNAPHNAFWHWHKLACGVGGPSFGDDTFAQRATAAVQVRTNVQIPRKDTAQWLFSDVEQGHRWRKVGVSGRFGLWRATSVVP